MLGKAANDKTMYDGLYDSYTPYLKADSLGELPDEKGKVKNRFRKDIAVFSVQIILFTSMAEFI